MTTGRTVQLPSVGVIVGSIVALTFFCMFVTILMWLTAVGPAEAPQAFGQPLPAGWEAGWRPKSNALVLRWRLGSVSDHPIRFAAFVTFFVVGVGICFLPRFTRREEPKPAPFPAQDDAPSRKPEKAG